jgi:hypothetical protein
MPTDTEDLEHLKQQKERAELRAQIAALTAPWWRKASHITVITAIIAAILPITKMIEEHYRNKRDFAQAVAREQNTLRMAYLDRYGVPGHRQRTLRFLIATTEDPRLQSWAQAELEFVKAELKEIEQKQRLLLELIQRTKDVETLAALQKQLEELNRQQDIATLRPPVPIQESDPAGAGSGSSGSSADPAGSATLQRLR